MITVEQDGVCFHIAEAHDFGWVKEYGKVFRVFDDQDSGNICFGIQGLQNKFFIKYAGARTVRYEGQPEDAIHRLRKAVCNYEDLRCHPLVNLLGTSELENGYAAIFDWFEGESLYRYRFNRFPLKARMMLFQQILDFHVYVEEQGYVAIDFYDGSLIYDFESRDMKICDIDLYARRPYLNEKGRLWGSSRFMLPEEFEMGAVIDQRTNVFNMGATAFLIFGGALDRSREKWAAGDKLYEVALKAVCRERTQRYGTVRELADAWGQS